MGMSIWVRLRFTALVITDRLLGTHLVEREMAHLRRRVKTFEAQAIALKRHMEELNCLLHIVQVQLCVLYLRQRQMLQPVTWLRFAPAENAEEERDLDMLIGQLAKHGLSTVQTETSGERVYIYHLHPDWHAIAGVLSSRQNLLDPTTASWLNEMRSNENG